MCIIPRPHGPGDRLLETAARDFQQRQRDCSRDAERDFRQSGIVLVRNDSGHDRERFDVLAVAGPIVGPSANADEFKRRVAIKGVVPRKRHKGRFAVLLEPVAAGAIGRAVIDGVTCVRVKMVEETDRFADIAKGNPSFLRSGLTGAAFLLWVQPRDDRDSPIIAWCIAPAPIGGRWRRNARALRR